MKKLTRQEGIAVAVGLVSVIAFVPAVFTSGIQTQDTHSFTSADNSSDSLSELHLEKIETAISDFQIEDVAIGDGEEAVLGDTVYVHYVGSFANGDVFDTSTGNREPYKVTLGQGEVITGWEIGLVGMREGGTRHLVIPPALGYGAEELADAKGTVIIPRNTTLMFDIVLLQVQKNSQ